MVLILGLATRISWVMAAISVIFFYKSNSVMLWVFISLYAVFEILNACVSIFWQELLGRSLLPEKRSTVFGIREFTGNLISFILGFPVLFILKNLSFPNNFILLFIISSVGTMASYVSLAMLREAPYDKTENHGYLEHFKTTLQLPMKDVTFRWYIIFTFFFYGFNFLGSLLTALGIERFETVIGKDTFIGVINMISLFSGAILTLVLSKIFDKFGKFKAFAIVSGLFTIIPLWALFSKNLTAYWFVFIFYGLQVVVWLFEMNTLLDFNPPEKRHQYIALLSIIKLFPIAVFTNLGGWMTDHLSSEITLLVASFFGTVAFIILIWKLGPLWQKEKRLSASINL